MSPTQGDYIKKETFADMPIEEIQTSVFLPGTLKRQISIPGYRIS